MIKFIKNAPHKENMNVQRATSKKKMSLLGLMMVCVISLGIFMQSCSSENDVTETETINSVELENFILAGIELQHSLKIFDEALAKVDFANLETVIENGKEVMYLPATVRSINIEDKMLQMNKKKEILINECPQLLTQHKPNFVNSVNGCIKQSAKINKFCLANKINIYSPVLKSVIETYSFDSMSYLVSFLYSWVMQADPDTTKTTNYVELSIVFFTDGTHVVVLDDTNTYKNSNLTLTNPSPNTYTYGGKEVSSVAHTHDTFSSSGPSDKDLEEKAAKPGLNQSIFYNGAFYPF